KDFRTSGAPGRLEFPGTAASVQPEDQSETGTIWSHLSRNNVSFYNFGGGLDRPDAGAQSKQPVFSTNIPMPIALFTATSREFPTPSLEVSDTDRAERFIREVNARFSQPEALPQFLYVSLPGSRTQKSRPESGYPYSESFAADTDLAIGRIVEYLSGTKW